MSRLTTVSAITPNHTLELSVLSESHDLLSSTARSERMQHHHLNGRRVSWGK